MDVSTWATFYYIFVWIVVIGCLLSLIVSLGIEMHELKQPVLIRVVNLCYHAFSAMLYLNAILHGFGFLNRIAYWCLMIFMVIFFVYSFITLVYLICVEIVLHLELDGVARVRTIVFRGNASYRLAPIPYAHHHKLVQFTRWLGNRCIVSPYCRVEGFQPYPFKR